MHIKAIASAIALATSLGLAGAVYAQTPVTVNGLTVTEVDLPLVQAYCEQLQSGMTPDSADDASAAASDEAPVGDDDAAAEASEPTIDLGQITLEGCVEAGLITAAAN